MLNFLKKNLISLIFGILVICFVIGFYILAWTEPTSSPPEGNVAAPLNTSISPQTKGGALTLYDRITATGFYDSVFPNYFIDPYVTFGPSVNVKGYIQAEGGYKSSTGSTGATTGFTIGSCFMVFQDGLFIETNCD